MFCAGGPPPFHGAGGGSFRTPVEPRGVTATTDTKALVTHTQDLYKKYLSPSLARLLKFSGYDTVEWRAEGVFVYDPDGKPYLDCAGGYGVFVAGHRPPSVVAAVKDQLDKMPLSAKVFFNAPMAELAERLAAIAPGTLQFSFICNSGTEAVEGALKLARLATGKPQIIHAANAFHGKTMGSLSASGRDMYKQPFEPLVPDHVQVPFGDAAAVAAAITDQTAAVIVEPIQGEGGVMIPPDDYLPRLREICTRTGVLLVLDEVQTGLGRTGELFACSHWKVAPDILILAKALGGGVMPIGAYMGTPEVWKCLAPHPLLHTSTFGGNPLACRAALATLDLIEREGLVDRARTNGAYLMEALRGVQTRHPKMIAEVRGKGLLIGVEMAEEKFAGAVIFEMSRRGVIGVYTLNMPRVIRFEPPLIITTEQMDQAVAAFEGAVAKAESMFLKESA